MRHISRTIPSRKKYSVNREIPSTASRLDAIYREAGQLDSYCSHDPTLPFNIQ